MHEYKVATDYTDKYIVCCLTFVVCCSWCLIRWSFAITPRLAFMVVIGIDWF